MRFCPRCGTESKDGSRYCQLCGKRVVDGAQEDSGQADQPTPPGTAMTRQRNIVLLLVTLAITGVLTVSTLPGPHHVALVSQGAGPSEIAEFHVQDYGSYIVCYFALVDSGGRPVASDGSILFELSDDREVLYEGFFTVMASDFGSYALLDESPLIHAWQVPYSLMNRSSSGEMLRARMTFADGATILASPEVRLALPEVLRDPSLGRA